MKFPFPRLRPLGISARLFIAILITATVSITVAGVVTRLAFERGFLGYLNNLATERMSYVLPRVQQAYAEHGNWDFLREHPRAWFMLVRPAPGDEIPADWKPETGIPPRSDLTGAVMRLTLLDAQQQWVAGYRNAADGPREAVRYQDQVVGWLVLAPFQSVADGGDQRFQEGQRLAGRIALAVGLVLAALIAWSVSRQFVRPVKQVAAATHALAQGNREVRVQIKRSDEVGQLARDFNHLALTLSRNAASRREFIADVSHELRTPLAVLRGELEALSDGIRPMNTDAVASLLSEARQMQGLVDDLHELALSDIGAMRYRMETLDLVKLLQRAAETHRPRLAQSGLTLQTALPAGPARIEGDESRLRQLFDNIIENSRRYTDAPGQVMLRLEAAAQAWELVIEDSAPGAPPEDLARLFERFFRVDRSRNRAGGGSGLGLAICRNIVLAHEGQIKAEASPLGGVRIRITLPRQPGPASTPTAAA